jgi:hypothetical protein
MSRPRKTIEGRRSAYGSRSSVRARIRFTC